jgi:hypothetical protein
VDLLPEKPMRREELLHALQEKYGMWTSGLVWIDRANNYSVEFDPYTGIQYRPLHAKEIPGL